MDMHIARALVLAIFALTGCGAPASAGIPPTRRATSVPTATPAFATVRPITPAPTATMPDAVLPEASFGFIFTYGVCVSSRVDTFAGTFYRAGESLDPPVTVSMALTPTDMQRIQRAVDEIDYFRYPATFVVRQPSRGAASAFTPASHYVFQIREGTRQHTVRWLDDVIGVVSEQADQLRALADLIERTVHGVPAVAALPPLHVGCA